MKAISIRQPFASLIQKGLKKLEIRTWRTSFRGDILICASLTAYNGEAIISDANGVMHVECYNFAKLFPRGVALCVATITDCRLMKINDKYNACHKFVEGSYVWELSNIRQIESFDVKGKLSFFEVEDEKIKFV